VCVCVCVCVCVVQFHLLGKPSFIPGTISLSQQWCGCDVCVCVTWVWVSHTSLPPFRCCPNAAMFSDFSVEKLSGPQITIEELSQHFHLPLKDASKQLGLSTTAIKKLCRDHGIKRWPQRKIKSFNRQLEQLEVSLASAQTSIEVHDIQNEMEHIRFKKANLIASLLSQRAGGTNSPQAARFAGVGFGQNSMQNTMRISQLVNAEAGRQPTDEDSSFSDCDSDAPGPEKKTLYNCLPASNRIFSAPASVTSFVQQQQHLQQQQQMSGQFSFPAIPAKGPAYTRNLTSIPRSPSANEYRRHSPYEKPHGQRLAMLNLDMMRSPSAPIGNPAYTGGGLAAVIRQNSTMGSSAGGGSAGGGSAGGSGADMEEDTIQTPVRRVWR